MEDNERTEAAQEQPVEARPDAQQEAAPENAGQEKKEEKKKTVGQEILSWIVTFAVAIVLALGIRTLIFEPVRVDGHSMDYTLADDEYMIVTKYDYLFGEPERGDVVICHYPDRGRTNFVKRLVALPGDTVSMLNGTLYVNGEPVDEPYITNRANYNMQAVSLGKNEYFVLGDNRSSSNDSHLIGPISRDQIKGHVRCVAFPFKDARVVH